MSAALVIFFGAVGWCGTVGPWWWRKPGPPPPPDPWWIIDRIVGIIGGVIGGWLFTQGWPIPDQGDIGRAVVAAGVAALVGSLILLDIYGLVRARQPAQVASGSPAAGAAAKG
jgi:uncharacterized membrane protein YeaQ/YmgE (transglycosylase-associated protein family)